MQESCSLMLQTSTDSSHASSKNRFVAVRVQVVLLTLQPIQVRFPSAVTPAISLVFCHLDEPQMVETAAEQSVGLFLLQFQLV